MMECVFSRPEAGNSEECHFHSSAVFPPAGAGRSPDCSLKRTPHLVLPLRLSCRAGRLSPAHGKHHGSHSRPHLAAASTTPEVQRLAGCRVLPRVKEFRPRHSMPECVGWRHHRLLRFPSRLSALGVRVSYESCHRCSRGVVAGGAVLDEPSAQGGFLPTLGNEASATESASRGELGHGAQSRQVHSASRVSRISGAAKST